MTRAYNTRTRARNTVTQGRSGVGMPYKAPRSPVEIRSTTNRGIMNQRARMALWGKKLVIDK